MITSPLVPHRLMSHAPVSVKKTYANRAPEECRQFMALLRQTFGPEPVGTRLATKWFAHDFGQYCEVVVWFETDIPESVDYAYRCEGETPATWEG